MKHNITEFRYSVILSMDMGTIMTYLNKTYEERISLRDTYDFVTVQLDEIECEWKNVGVYTSFDTERFSNDIYSATQWGYIMRKAGIAELDSLGDNEFTLYSDNRDDLNDCINAIVDHCTRHDISGYVSDIVFHVRPIEWGAREF